MQFVRGVLAVVLCVALLVSPYAEAGKKKRDNTAYCGGKYFMMVCTCSHRKQGGSFGRDPGWEGYHTYVQLK